MLTVVPVAKADPDVDRIAARLEPAMRRAFLAMVEAFKDALPLDLIVEAFDTANFAAVQEALVRAAIPPDTVAAFNDILGQALQNVAAPTAAQFGLSFTLDNPLAVTWIERHGAQLVVEVTEETRRAIADVIRRGVIEGIPPRSQGRMLRRIVGLTSRDAGAVRNLAAALAADGVAAARIDRQVAAYAARLLRRRGENIARTETMFAANRGQLAAWQHAADQGLLNRETTRRVWIVTTDERLCPLCAPMEGVTVGLDSAFISDTEATGFTVTSRTGEDRITVAESRPRRQPVSTVTPPLHPSCRCTTGLVFG